MWIKVDTDVHAQMMAMQICILNVYVRADVWIKVDADVHVQM